jgi:hypothetical protein
MAEAKTIIKNKFWIVEENGKQIATIQATDSGVIFANSNSREKFINIKMLTKKYNINFVNNKKQSAKPPNQVYDFPSDATPYNPLYDVKHKLPLYTKQHNSKCFYCAGFYLVNIENEWFTEFCPKRIILMRNKFFGPFKSAAEADKFLAEGKLLN